MPREDRRHTREEDGVGDVSEAALRSRRIRKDGEEARVSREEKCHGLPFNEAAPVLGVEQRGLAWMALVEDIEAPRCDLHLETAVRSRVVQKKGRLEMGR